MKSIAGYIDHTLLKVNITDADLKRHCEEAVKYGFFSVCVHPIYVKTCKKYLEGTSVKVVTVAGFPMGESATDVRVYEAKRCEEDGADEIDTVIPVSKLYAGDYDYVYNDIKSMVSAVNVPVKVILETSQLTDELIVKACEICERAGAAFVKTSTGFFGKGAEVEKVALMKKSVKGNTQVKAAGGIKDYATAKAMVDAGATRLGVSAGVAIAEQEKLQKV